MKFRDKAWVYISFFTLMTAMIWFAISIRTVLHRSTIPEKIENIVKPIDPSLDTNVFSSLQQRGG